MKFEDKKIRRIMSLFPRLWRNNASIKASNDFRVSLSKYLQNNLSEDLIIKIQNSYIKLFNNNMALVQNYLSAPYISSSNNVWFKDRENKDEYMLLFDKRIVEYSILFFNQNKFIDNRRTLSERQRHIFELLNGTRSKIEEDENYNVITKLFKYDYKHDSEFSECILSFLSDISEDLKSRMKDNSRTINVCDILKHSFITYSGKKIDYDSMVFSEFSNSDNLHCVGDIFSKDPKYFAKRFKSIKRKSGYMDRRFKVIDDSLDNFVFDLELAQLAGSLSKGNTYNVARKLSRDAVLYKAINAEKFSAYVAKFIATSKDESTHYQCWQLLSDKDLPFCIPILSSSLKDYYGSNGITGLQERINKLSLK